MPNPALLEAFPTPAEQPFVIEHTADEFTSVCPKTGHPDFGVVTVRFEPRAASAGGVCVELKSLKMYMWSYRDQGAFHEKVTNDILSDMVKAINPRFLRITAKWYVRGGIYTNVVVEHRKKGWKPAPKVDLPQHNAETGLLG